MTKFVSVGLILVAGYLLGTYFPQPAQKLGLK